MVSSFSESEYLACMETFVECDTSPEYKQKWEALPKEEKVKILQEKTKLFNEMAKKMEKLTNHKCKIVDLLPYFENLHVNP